MQSLAGAGDIFHGRQAVAEKLAGLPVDGNRGLAEVCAVEHHCDALGATRVHLLLAKDGEPHGVGAELVVQLRFRREVPPGREAQLQKVSDERDGRRGRGGGRALPQGARGDGAGGAGRLLSASGCRGSVERKC